LARFSRTAHKAKRTHTNVFLTHSTRTFTMATHTTARKQGHTQARIQGRSIAVVGATGLVGRTILDRLEARKFPVKKLLPVASKNSVGKTITFCGEPIKVISMEDAIAQKPEIALFAAGGKTSKDFAPKFAEVGTLVIDNSSHFRMDPNVPLVVPEINLEDIQPEHFIVANPNCSTIQLVMALKPLHDRFIVRRAIVSTYQSVSGTGQAALDQLNGERAGREVAKVYPHPIDMNCLPHCDVFLENDFTREEMKLHHETKKILGDQSISISATSVRVPAVGGHSESVYLELDRDFSIPDVREALKMFPGIIVQDKPGENLYPMPISAQGKDDVFVGRIRRDLTEIQGLHLWIVSDNLHKGAATNALQIAEYLNKAGRFSKS
jgi:aspartate-semialdehyde dehydrogenase